MLDFGTTHDTSRVGPARGGSLESAARMAVSTEAISIGREPHTDQLEVVLDDDEVSRQHARVRRHGSVVVISDVGSRNGVHVNGHRIQVHREVPLHAGDILRLGNHIAVMTESPGVHDEIAPGLWGGARMRGVCEPALVIRKNQAIVIEGETGTGKEVVSRAIHRSSRTQGAFVAVNCAGISKQSPESELFGYADGTFTGGRKGGTKGHFRRADGGTLLLDEVCELPGPVQALLLRVLEERHVQPQGDAEPIPIDVRVIVAAQRPLEQEVRLGRFREDLFARLEGRVIRLPPLRERREDIAPLFARTLRELSGKRSIPAVEARLIERLCVYDWPRNVRQLMHVTESLFDRHGTERSLKARHLDDLIQATFDEPPSTARTGQRATPARGALELEALRKALRDSNGNKTTAAELLHVDRSKFLREIKKHPDVDWNSIGKEEESP